MRSTLLLVAHRALLIDEVLPSHSDGKVQHRRDCIADLERRTRIDRAIDNHDGEVRHGRRRSVGTRFAPFRAAACTPR